MAGEAEKLDNDLVVNDDGTVDVALLDDKGKAPPLVEDDEEHLSGRDDGGDNDDEDPAEGTGGGKKRTSARERRARQRRAREESDTRFAQLWDGFQGQQKLINALVGNARETSAGTLRAQMGEGEKAYKDAQARHAQAVTDADGVAATKAVSDMQAATVYYHTAKSHLDRVMASAPAAAATGGTVDGGGERQQQQQQKPVPTRQKELTTAFMKRHTWFDPSSQDPTSTAVRAIDGGVLKDGFDPSNQDYWDELESRLRTEMPHRFKKGQAGPPTGGNDRGGGSQGANRFRLTPEMMKGLEDAGLMGTDEVTTKRRQAVVREMMAKQKELSNG